MLEIPEFLPLIRKLHDLIRAEVLVALGANSSEDLVEIVAHQGGDIVFALDQVSEKVLIEYVDNEIAAKEPVILVAEGIPNGRMILPTGAAQTDCRWQIIVDPIDGSRLIIFQKRSGWILTGVAPNRGENTSLKDIQLAVQTEIPILKQHLSDQLWAIRGQGTRTERYNLRTQERSAVSFQPTPSESIKFGYASISRFFTGQRDVLAKIEDEMIRQVLGDNPTGTTITFEDQYASTGGQIYELLRGADRFLADLRPLMKKIADERGENLAHCCHPYDICTSLIAEELGVAITAPDGLPLDVPLDTETNVAWVGYGNALIREQIEPVFSSLLQEQNLI